MRNCLALVLASAFVLAGCPKPAEPVTATNVVRSNDLELKLALEKRTFAPGEKFTATVTATNVSGDPITIKASSGAAAWLTVYAYNPLRMDQVERYPKSAMSVPMTWTLDPGQSRSFTMELTVEPNWPRGEFLLLSAELNGRPNPVVGVVISVSRETPTPAAPPSEAAPAAAVTPAPAAPVVVTTPKPTLPPDEEPAVTPVKPTPVAPAGQDIIEVPPIEVPSSRPATPGAG